MDLLVDTARAAGTTVVLVTHEPRIAAYADREVIVRDGRCATYGRRPVIRLGAAPRGSGGREASSGSCSPPSAWPSAPRSCSCRRRRPGDPGPPAPARPGSTPGSDQSELEGRATRCSGGCTTDAVDRPEMAVLRVAAAWPRAPVPLGLSHVPAPGRGVRVAAAGGADRASSPPTGWPTASPSAPAGTIDGRLPRRTRRPGRRRSACRRTRSRRPGAMEVHHVRTAPAPLQFTDFLRLVLGIGAVGLLMPVVVFVSTSTRLGAARREQRFAALRLAGCHAPADERDRRRRGRRSGRASGAVLGAVGFLLLRPWAAGIEIDGQRSFVPDVRVRPGPDGDHPRGRARRWPSCAAMAGLRRLQISPLGRRPPGRAGPADGPPPRAGRASAPSASSPRLALAPGSGGTAGAGARSWPPSP